MLAKIVVKRGPVENIELAIDIGIYLTAPQIPYKAKNPEIALNIMIYLYLIGTFKKWFPVLTIKI